MLLPQVNTDVGRLVTSTATCLNISVCGSLALPVNHTHFVDITHGFTDQEEHKKLLSNHLIPWSTRVECKI